MTAAERLAAARAQNTLKSKPYGGGVVRSALRIVGEILAHALRLMW